MYELLILSLLMAQPMHGYRISKIMNNIVGPFARFSNGRLYPLLNQLEEGGLIVAQPDAGGEPENGRAPRSYAITDAGKARFRVLMLDTASNPADYPRYFMRKVDALYHLPREDRLYIVDHYITFCQTHLHYLVERADVWFTESRRISEDEYDAAREVYQHIHDQWQLELDWAMHLRAKIGAR